MTVLIDVPWAKHTCFLDNAQARRAAREAVQRAAQRGRGHTCVLGYSVANEIPPLVVRWHGARRVERFLTELADVARQADPAGLVTYATFPPTEYLTLAFADFVTFNVYLHDPETFRRYLFRLQNLVGDRPLVLGELGMDTIRHGDAEQARFLASHLCEARLMGLAGAFVFSWTDDWHTGGHSIQDWAFGITRADRASKASCAALQEVFDRPLAALLPRTPRVSVVVCSYNGGRTLAESLRSLRALDYPDYEVIVVDDGSTDDTRAVLASFPDVRAIHQPNRGLSAARNVGLHAATGAIVAYTDSDCFADPGWLTHLVYQLERSGAAAVGGPNLTPEDGWLAACVAAAPGQPTHVLESDQTAEHIPGCNMAIRREALEAIQGFDPQFRKAGDDVDVCWRLQQAGFWITFAPGAFVWHHRRQGTRAYFRQQAGYGEAEALLQLKHPDKFNGRGEGKWRGVLYGSSLQGVRLGGPLIHRGPFASGLFQCLYQRGPAHWAMLPSTLEWHLATVVPVVAGVVWTPAWFLAVLMLVLSVGVAVLQAAQAVLPPRHDGLLARLLLVGLCYGQPLVRSSQRYRRRVFWNQIPPTAAPLALRSGKLSHLGWNRTVSYWTEERDRAELVGLFVVYLLEQGWKTTVDSGWTEWDLAARRHPWTFVRVCTAQEEHGGGKRLIRVRYRLRLTRFAWITGLLGLAVTVAAATVYLPAAAGAGLLAACFLAAWWRGARLAADCVAGFDRLARDLSCSRCDPTP
jgi:GT2 family glycosyltransferase